MSSGDDRASNLALMLGVGILLIFFVAVIGPVSWAHREPEMRETMAWPMHTLQSGEKKVYTNPRVMKYSPDNSLVVRKSEDNKQAYKAYEKLVDSVLLPYEMKDGSAEEVMYPIWDEYFPLIGANGLLHTLNDRKHSLGPISPSPSLSLAAISFSHLYDALFPVFPLTPSFCTVFDVLPVCLLPQGCD